MALANGIEHGDDDELAGPSEGVDLQRGDPDWRHVTQADHLELGSLWFPRGSFHPAARTSQACGNWLPYPRIVPGLFSQR
ncbi:hypothetical protein [Streptomyces sp. NPDC056549]|uniref:hypothetical protein n=1 Tax=Streptomyces sp. NPDC056549 TaxID=3345864 RepID=UPI0036803B9F